MNCNDFWKKYEDTGLTPELEQHLARCEKCQMEMQIENALDSSLKILPRFEAPDRIWNNICLELQTDLAPDTSGLSLREKVKRSLKNIFSVNMLFFPRPLFAGVIITLIALIWIFYFNTGPLTSQQKLKLQAEAIEEIERTEKEYLDSIARLTELAEDNKDNINPEIYDIYWEKLTILDDYILECKEAINENKYNPQVRYYLATAYKEKTETLREMIEYTQQ